MPPTEPSPDREPQPPVPLRRKALRAAAVVSVLAVVVAWLYILFGYRPERQLDELADPTFPTAAEQICAATMAEVEALPPASAARTAAERAEVVEQADALLAAMVAELRSAAPTGADAASRGVREWVSDWADHVEDRQQYAADLRKDPDTRFLERTKGARQLSRAIDGFAEVNRMASCATPGDVG